MLIPAGIHGWKSGLAAAWTGTPPMSQPPTSPEPPGNGHRRYSSVRRLMAVGRRTELSLPTIRSAFAGDAPQSQSKREPPFGAAAGSTLCGPTAVRIRCICAGAALSSRLDPGRRPVCWVIFRWVRRAVGTRPWLTARPTWCRWPAPVRNGEWGQHTRHVVSQHHCRPGLAVAGWSVRGPYGAPEIGGEDERVRGRDGDRAPG